MQMPFQEVYQKPMPICASPCPPCEDRLSHGNIPIFRGATCEVMTYKQTHAAECSSCSGNGGVHTAERPEVVGGEV